MKKETLFLPMLFVSFFLILNSVTATTDTIGGTGFADYGSANYVWEFPITASASGSLTSIGIYIDNPHTTHFRLGIYTDNGLGTAPLTLLGQSADSSVVSGWNDISVTGVSIVSGSKYWIGWQSSDNAGSDTVYLTAGGTRCDMAQGYGSFPTPYIAGGCDSYTGYLRMTYAPANNPPYYYANITSLPVTYPNSLETFNASWYNSTDSMFNSLIELNFTGTLTNYTMTQISQNATYTVYGYQNNLGAGTYKFRFIGNTTAGKYNSTPYAISNITQANSILTSVSCTPNPASTTDTVTCLGTQNNAVANDLNFTLWNSTTLLNSTLGSNSLLYYISAWIQGTFTILFNNTAGTNFTSNTTGINTTLTVTTTTTPPSSANLISVCLNGQSALFNAGNNQYTSLVGVSCSTSQPNYYLYGFIGLAVAGCVLAVSLSKKRKSKEDILTEIGNKEVEKNG